MATACSSSISRRSPDAQAILYALAGCVGVPMGSAGTAESSGGRAEVLVLDFLRGKNVLIVLDNCEHLLDECADLVDQLLGTCPHLTVLATSREALNIEGEQSVRLPSLSVPSDESDMHTSEAVSLFKARAQAVSSTFDLTPDNARVVVEICQRLDGIPLAIEFAASRITHMSPHEIAERLTDMFKLLTGGRRRVQRQQTLQAALDWSYELLSDPEQRLLMRLAVFAGSFSLAAVEGVCADKEVARDAVVDLIGSLVQKSLVNAEGNLQGATRYRLLETVRLYAAEKLRETFASDDFRARHRDWYLEFVSAPSWKDTLFSSSVLHRFEPELSNLRAALEWCVAEDRLDLVMRIAGRMGCIWHMRGLWEEGYRWLTLARIEDLGLDADVMAESLMVASYVATPDWSSDPGAYDLAKRASAASGGTPSGPLVAATLHRLVARAVIAEISGDPAQIEKLRSEFEQATAIAAGISPFWHAWALFAWGNAELTLSNADAALANYEQAISLFPADHEAVAVATKLSLGVAAHVLGRHDRAREIADDLRGIRSEIFWNWGSGLAIAVALGRAGSGDIQSAHNVICDALLEARRSQPTTVHELLEGAAAALFLSGRVEDASRLLSFLRVTVFDDPAIGRTPIEYFLYRHYSALVRNALSKERAQQLRDEGREMSEDEAVALVLGPT